MLCASAYRINNHGGLPWPKMPGPISCPSPALMSRQRNKASRGIQSYAALRSINAINTGAFDFFESSRIRRRINMASEVDLLARNPYCVGRRIFSYVSLILLMMTPDITFDRVAVMLNPQ